MAVALEPVVGADAPPVGDARPRFRPDIDGLRAFAVLVVVLYHARMPGFEAGFVGVDVFFVISGFLITQLLTHELESTRSLGLARFWGRRARRLLPAATLMVGAVLGAALLDAPVLDWQVAATEAMATSLYWSNELFAGRATDYFGAGISASPLLHTWSLAVEEQFYVLWPLVLLGATRLARKSGSSPARLRVAAVALVTAISLASANSLAGSPAAFFSARARAWELGVGALLALAAPTVTPLLGRALRAALGLAGLSSLIAAVGLIAGHGAASVSTLALPVLGAAAVIAAGLGGPWPGMRMLTSAHAQYVGRLSYSWYLWHWPVLVVGLRHVPRDSAGMRLVLVGVSLLPAIATHHLVESPLRLRPRLLASPRASLVAGAALVAAAVAFAGTVWASAESKLRDPFFQQLVAARADWPPLETACATTDVAKLEARCVLGDRDAPRRILVIGDSHAAQWLPAIDGAAKRAGLAVIASVQGSCPAVGHGWTQGLPSCFARLRDLPATIDQVDPSFVIVASSTGYIGALVDAGGNRIPDGQQLRAWEDAHAEFAQRLARSAIGLLHVLDIPRWPSDPIDCLAEVRQPGGCDLPAEDAVASVAAAHRAERTALARADHGTAFDPTSLVCGDTTCPAVDRGVVVYTDSNHLTATFSRSTAPAFHAQFDAIAAAG